MTDVLVILPAGVAPPPLPEGVALRPCATGAEVVEALDGASGDVGAVVLCVDSLEASEAFEASAEAIAAAVAASDAVVLEVALAPWDGETPSPVSAACRGVIAGFGPAGLAAAVDLLRDRA